MKLHFSKYGRHLNREAHSHKAETLSLTAEIGVLRTNKKGGWLFELAASRALVQTQYKVYFCCNLSLYEKNRAASRPAADQLVHLRPKCKLFETTIR